LTSYHDVGLNEREPSGIFPASDAITSAAGAATRQGVAQRLLPANPPKGIRCRNAGCETGFIRALLQRTSRESSGWWQPRKECQPPVSPRAEREQGARRRARCRRAMKMRRLYIGSWCLAVANALSDGLTKACGVPYDGAEGSLGQTRKVPGRVVGLMRGP
jgi:hypothetical protein